MSSEASATRVPASHSSSVQPASSETGTGKADPDSNEDAIECLRKEIERLKTRLEEERKKLNDVTCELSMNFCLLFFHLSFS